MARSIDEMRGALIAIQQNRLSEHGRVFFKELKKIADDRLAQDYTAKGEEAIRALGFQQGIGVALSLFEIFEATVKQMEKSNMDNLAKTLKI
jgi:hypothetical protein